jgi:hypothetical protein
LILAILAFVLVHYQRTPVNQVKEAVAKHATVSLAMRLQVAIIGI